MKMFRISLLAFSVFFVSAIALHAQGGCVDSPEAPTDVLMLVGSIGMIYGSSVVTKMLRKRKKQ